MKKFSGTLAVSVALLMFFSISAPASADIVADWKKLAEFHESFTPYLSEASATHDDQFVTGWLQWRESFAPFVQKFRSTYGSTREELTKSFEGVEAPEGIYVYPYNLVELIILDVDAHQKRIASWLQKQGDSEYARWEAFKDPPQDKLELKADYAQRALTKYRHAQRLDPGLDGEPLAKVERAFKESSEAFKKNMQGLKWPGHNPNFSGPGNPDALATAALKLLRDMRDQGKQWSKPEYDDEHIPVAAAVTGNRWEVYKEAPLTRQPTQYSLQFLVAFKGTKDPSIAYVYTMHFYTDERAGVTMEPPFYYCNSAQYAKYKMLLENVPVGKAGVTGTGPMAVIFRLVLSLLLICGGIAAWNQFLRLQLPQLAGVWDALAGQKQVLGYALLGFGTLALLRTALFQLSPLADILPQLSALALGLAMVSIKDLQEKTSNAKMKSIVTKLEPAGSALAPHLELLGKIALALGLIHLIIGKSVLF